MNIYLLTHTRELERKTNTGTLVKQILGKQCSVFVWQRKKPNVELLQRINDESVALLYPWTEMSIPSSKPKVFDSYIIIDATWQEAQKMYNHSPYLHALPKISLKPSQPSRYTLRRNQKDTGLCTAECAIELFKHHNDITQANNLNSCLSHLMLHSKGSALSLFRERNTSE